ncbi:DUF547 domain-containing protein [Nitrospiraceae bacterium AH_259_D15_M11_P09]|nr:DUF547 domain-containing protein [Nitrospiraceae bacterium AH_259_D15_M11_P09]
MRIHLPTVLALTLLFSSTSALAAPKGDLWDRWLAHDPQSTVTVDHMPWARFLKANIVRGADGVNRLPYATISAADRAALEGYLARLAEVPVGKLNQTEQRAFWINLYNALTVSVILEHYPVKSILDIDISPGFFSDGPWGKKLVSVEGVKVSLDDIEHRILRPIWKDPRIHYAVNCASIGCPNLQAQAFTSENADDLLSQAAREHVNHPRGARVEDEKLVVSSIYRWFAADFGGNDRAVIAHLKQYAEPRLRGRLERLNRISSHGYDWALNEVR